MMEEERFSGQARTYTERIQCSGPQQFCEVKLGLELPILTLLGLIFCSYFSDAAFWVVNMFTRDT